MKLWTVNIKNKPQNLSLWLVTYSCQCFFSDPPLQKEEQQRQIVFKNHPFALLILPRLFRVWLMLDGSSWGRVCTGSTEPKD